MRDPEPRPVAETARQEGAPGPVKSMDAALSGGERDVRDLVMAQAAEIADQVGANA